MCADIYIYINDCRVANEAVYSASFATFFLFLGVVQFMVLRICIYNKIPTFRYCEKHKTMIPLFIEIQRVILLNRQVVKQ